MYRIDSIQQNVLWNIRSDDSSCCDGIEERGGAFGRLRLASLCAGRWGSILVWRGGRSNSGRTPIVLSVINL